MALNAGSLYLTVEFAQVSLRQQQLLGELE
jgi:hypothetical protein